MYGLRPQDIEVRPYKKFEKFCKDPEQELVRLEWSEAEKLLRRVGEYQRPPNQ